MTTCGTSLHHRTKAIMMFHQYDKLRHSCSYNNIYVNIYNIYQNKHDRLLLKWCCNCKWQFKLKPLTTLQRCWFRRNEEVPSLCFGWESNQTYWNCFQWLLPAQYADHWAMTVSPSVTQWQCCHVLVTRTLSTLVPSCFLTGTHCISVLKCFCYWDS